MTRDEALTLKRGDTVILRDLEWRVRDVVDRTSTAFLWLSRENAENAFSDCRVVERKPAPFPLDEVRERGPFFDKDVF